MTVDPRPVRVTHVITGLDTGGAESMLAKLLSATDRERCSPQVISLTTLGAIAEDISALDVPVMAAQIRRDNLNPAGIAKVACLLRRGRPDVVQTWLYHADLIGGLAARLAGVRSIAWNLRQSAPDERNKPTTVRVARVCSRLSRWVPTRIVCCSEAVASSHVAVGYDAARMTIIPNGFDTARYHPDKAARRRVRESLGIPDASPAIGYIARFDPQKDHDTFFRAAAIIHQRRPDAHFVLAGLGISVDNPTVKALVEKAHLGEVTHLLGLRRDTPAINASLDVAASASRNEGFSNAIGEAMACSVPAVVTDVSAAHELVGETGKIVHPGDPAALAVALLQLIDLRPAERAALGTRARQRVIDRFSIGAVASRYEDLYRSLAPATNSRVPSLREPARVRDRRHR